MEKGHAYFELIDVLKQAGCPVCNLLIKDSRSYLEHLLYESVLDVPTRMELQESFGLCNWHSWQLPRLPYVCSPDTGFAIFAIDLLRNFNHIAETMEKRCRKQRRRKWLLRKLSNRFLPRLKKKACPACRYVRQFEAYHLKNIVAFLREEEFLQVYRVCEGLCLPHFFLLEQNHSTHPKFCLLLELQRTKVDALRKTLEEFIRKQDYRLRHEITAGETKAWRIAMGLLNGRPGTFTNELGHNLMQGATSRVRRKRQKKFVSS
ncbi:MAG: DUF6062 family protein [Candidatus Binatia bacterium]